jgi:hypothetical protein
MILKFAAFSTLGTVSALTVSSTSESFPPVLKVILLALFLSKAVVHLLRALDGYELSRYSISHITLCILYGGFAINVSEGVDWLLLLHRDILVASAAALLIFIVVEKFVQSYASFVNEFYFQLAQSISNRISKILPRRVADRLVQDEKINAKDFRVSAIHEAGHALLYGILDYVPESLFVYIDKRSHRLSDSNLVRVGGQVSNT